MSVITDCDLVVIGTPPDLEAFEATQTERFQASILAGIDTWDEGGWPGAVMRRAAPTVGRVMYSFSMSSNPIQWVEKQAPEWPELTFVAHCSLEGVNELPILYRAQFLSGAFVREEHLREGQGDRRTWQCWLVEAGVNPETLGPESVVPSRAE